MSRSFALVTFLLATPLYAETFPEMGIDPGTYTYEGKCEETYQTDGNLGPMSFVFDGANLNSANSSCSIQSVDFVSAGYLNAITTCVDNKSGNQTDETYTLLPDQNGANRIQLYATYVNGELTSEGNPGWFHLCRALQPSS